MTSPIWDIDITNQHESWPEVNSVILHAANVALQSAGYAEESELSIVLVDDAFIQNLNKKYRNKDKPTNVLSFPQDDDFSLGDIVLALETIERESKEQNKLFEHHLSHLVVHGTLHLLGYDHETDEEAEEMETLEVKILSELAIENPYLISDTPIDAV